MMVPTAILGDVIKVSVETLSLCDRFVVFFGAHEAKGNSICR